MFTFSEIMQCCKDIYVTMYLSDVYIFIHLIKTTTVQNEVTLSYHRVRGLYFLAVVFVATIDIIAVHVRRHWAHSYRISKKLRSTSSEV